MGAQASHIAKCGSATVSNKVMFALKTKNDMKDLVTLLCEMYGNHSVSLTYFMKEK